MSERKAITYLVDNDVFEFHIPYLPPISPIAWTETEYDFGNLRYTFLNRPQMPERQIFTTRYDFELKMFPPVDLPDGTRIWVRHRGPLVPNEGVRCLACGRNWDAGHAPDCKAVELLRKLRETLG